jgi:hypothetical protein
MRIELLCKLILTIRTCPSQSNGYSIQFLCLTHCFNGIPVSGGRPYSNGLPTPRRSREQRSTRRQRNRDSRRLFLRRRTTDDDDMDNNFDNPSNTDLESALLLMNDDGEGLNECDCELNMCVCVCTVGRRRARHLTATGRYCTFVENIRPILLPPPPTYAEVMNKASLPTYDQIMLNNQQHTILLSPTHNAFATSRRCSHRLSNGEHAVDNDCHRPRSTSA